MKDSVLEASFAVTVGEEGKAFSLQVDLQLDSGVLVLFGPSGAGKTLCLSVLSGRVQPQEGVVRLGERLLSDASEGVFVPPHLRRIGYVPQHHSLFPFASVVENVAFGLPRAERRADSPRVRDLLDQLGIAHLAEARPETLSGGERQRVALARALAVQPELLLLDEPLASLDVEGRAELRRVLADFLQSTSCPAVYVTHNVPEALDLGDKVLRMSRGRTENAGLPSEVLAAESVRVQGQVERVDRGSDFTAVHLREAVVTGPNSALAAEDDGRFRLNLRLDRD